MNLNTFCLGILAGAGVTFGIMFFHSKKKMEKQEDKFYAWLLKNGHTGSMELFNEVVNIKNEK